MKYGKKNRGFETPNPGSSEFPRNFLRKFRGKSLFFSVPRNFLRKFRGNSEELGVFEPKTTFCGLNNTYITFIKCLNQIMKSNFGVSDDNKHFYDCMKENHTT